MLEFPSSDVARKFTRSREKPGSHRELQHVSGRRAVAESADVPRLRNAVSKGEQHGGMVGGRAEER